MQDVADLLDQERCDPITDQTRVKIDDWLFYKRDRRSHNLSYNEYEVHHGEHVVEGRNLREAYEQMLELVQGGDEAVSQGSRQQQTHIWPISYNRWRFAASIMRAMDAVDEVKAALRDYLSFFEEDIDPDDIQSDSRLLDARDILRHLDRLGIPAPNEVWQQRYGQQAAPLPTTVRDEKRLWRTKP